MPLKNKVARRKYLRGYMQKARKERRYLSATRDLYRRQRARILEHYGAFCVCCGEQEPIFLAIDHVAGGGSAERREKGCGSRFYGRVIREGFPSRYQILCHNCNYAKSRGGCPHVHKERMV